MRKCINLEDQPGFEQIYSPVLQQAIDRGIEGHSGTGTIDWGYVTPDLTTKPTIRPGRGKPIPDKFPPEHYNVVNAVRLGKGEYWDYLFNTYATPAMRALVLKYPVPGIRVENSGGYFAYNEGQYGTVYTPKGSTTDITTFFHEYGHYLDNVIGFELQGINSSKDGGKIMSASRLFLSEMIADGKAMGMILDDTTYWKYIFDNGLDVRMTNRGRRIKVNKGADEEQVSAQMRVGDFWRVMDEILILSKNDIQRIKNTKNPDPVKLKRAQEVHANLTELYKQHLNRIKIAKKITKQVQDGKLGQSPMFEREADAGLWRHPGAIGDILDALSGGAIYDYEQATGDSFMMGGHSSRGGYYSVRLYEARRGRWEVRNWNLSVAEDFKRYEIFAQLTQFMAHQDNTAWEFMSKLMPNLTKSYESIIKNAGGHPKKNTAKPNKIAPANPANPTSDLKPPEQSTASVIKPSDIRRITYTQIGSGGRGYVNAPHIYQYKNYTIQTAGSKDWRVKKDAEIVRKKYSESYTEVEAYGGELMYPDPWNRSHPTYLSLAKAKEWLVNHVNKSGG